MTDTKLSLRDKLRISIMRFKESPLDFLDNIESPELRGHKITWGFRDSRFRVFAVIMVALSGVAWIVFGYDSTIHYFAKSIPLFAKTFGYTKDIGAGMHWSSIQIYCLEFFLLSYWASKNYVKGTRNVFFAATATLFTVGFFEIIWSALYDIILFQSWTIWSFGDGTVFWRNLIWIFCLPLSYPIISAGSEFKPKFKINWLFWAFLISFIVTMVFWVFYPFPHYIYQGFGNVGSPLFPQTVYTLNVPAAGGVSLDAKYIPDYAVHTVNIVAKYLVTFAFIVFFKVSVIHKKTKEGVGAYWTRQLEQKKMYVMEQSQTI